VSEGCSHPASAAGVALPAKHVWLFNTGTNVAAALPVNLGSAVNYVLLAKSAVSTVPTSAVTGLSGGALAKNVFWQVSGKVEIGTTAHFEGVVLSQTSVDLRTGASIDGRLMAQTAVNIQSSTFKAPAP